MRCSGRKQSVGSSTIASVEVGGMLWRPVVPEVVRKDRPRCRMSCWKHPASECPEIGLYFRDYEKVIPKLMTE